MRTRVWWPVLMIMALQVGGVGCAALKSKAKVTRVGTYDPKGEREVLERFNVAMNESLEVPSDAVAVLIATVPDGIEMDGTTVSVKKGFQHKILGQFEMKPDLGTFHGYRAGWKRGLCHAQTPLTWITLGVWMAVPTYWPCHTTNRADKDVFVDDARRLAVASGGDLVIMRFVDAGEAEAFAATGVIVKRDPRLVLDGDADPSADDSI